MLLYLVYFIIFIIEKQIPNSNMTVQSTPINLKQEFFGLLKQLKLLLLLKNCSKEGLNLYAATVINHFQNGAASTQTYM